MSCTSEPSRSTVLPFVLCTINFDLVSGVHVNLPKLYKNSTPYADTVNMIKRLHPKIKVYRPRNDIGPATKVIFTIDRLKRKYKHKRKSPICISIDDDVAYHSNLFGELAKHVEKKGSGLGIMGIRHGYIR